MKKIVLLAAIALLSGCVSGREDIDIATSDDIVIDGENLGSAPAARVPQLPENLARKAQALPEITDRSLAGQQRSAVEADRAYNSVAIQLNAVIDAWECVRVSLNDKTDPEECFK